VNWNGKAGRAFIYALLDPETMQVRYVGQTSTPSQRIESHTYGRTIGQNVDGTPVVPRMVVLEECDEVDRLAREREWIQLFAGTDDMANGHVASDGERDDLIRLSERFGADVVASQTCVSVATLAKLMSGQLVSAGVLALMRARLRESNSWPCVVFGAAS